MFKGIFDFKNKARKKQLPEKGSIQIDALPVLSADTILATEKREQILKDIRDLLSLPDQEYNEVFLAVIQKYAEFVQNIPETERSFFSSIGGMLDHALERTSLSLFLCRTYLLPEDATLASLSEEEMLWVYAVFTASLLLDVGKIATKHVITLTDENSNPIKHWLPYSGSMVSQASHYVYGFSEDNYDHIRRLITPLLAKQILSEVLMKSENHSQHENAFSWIANDPDVLEAWLGMLSDETRGVGSILTVIPLADAQLLESYFTDRKIFRQALPPQTIALLHKIKKDKKSMADALKKLKESLLTGDAERVVEKMEKAAKEKAAKQSMFGFPVTAQDQLHAMQHPLDLSAQHLRDIASRFIHWVQKGVETNKLSAGGQSSSSFYVADNKVFINQQVLSQFLSENKSLPINSINELKQALNQTELLRPLTASEILNPPPLPTQVSQILIVQAPSLVFGHGLSQIVNASTNQAQAVALQNQQIQQAPHVQTAQEKYLSDQQKLERQPQQMRPSPTGKIGG